MMIFLRFLIVFHLLSAEMRLKLQYSDASKLLGPSEAGIEGTSKHTLALQHHLRTATSHYIALCAPKSP